MDCRTVNYAARLSYREDKGTIGMPEEPDEESGIDEKIRLLVALVRSSKYCVVLTGAGISTAAGISDFRGPNGVWTLEARGISVSATDNSVFEIAQPTLTHMSIVGLVNAGIVKHVISQNVDGLHLRSGLARHSLSELHGNLFSEVCTIFMKC